MSEPLRLLSLPALGIAASVLLQSASAVCGKLAATSTDVQSPLTLYINPWFAASIACVALQALAWMAVLRRVAISVAYPFMALTYGLGVAAGWALFDEAIAPIQVLGVGLIVTGVYIANSEDAA